MRREEQSEQLLERLRARVAERANWSPLLRWYLGHYEAFAATLAEAGGRPSWDAIADELNASGLSARGRPISAAYARIVWWKARQIQARRQATTPEHEPSKGAMPSSRVERTSAVQPSQEAPTPPDDDFPILFMGGPKKRKEGT